MRNETLQRAQKRLAGLIAAQTKKQSALNKIKRAQEDLERELSELEKEIEKSKKIITKITNPEDGKLE